MTYNQYTYAILFYINFSMSYMHMQYLDIKIILNKQFVNYKVLDRVEYCNFDVALFRFEII